MEVNQEGIRQMDQYYLLITGGAALAGLAAVVVAAQLPKHRHVFRVPQGWAGLLYRDGIYVRRNNAGLHVNWGRGWTIRLMDLRRASLHVANQAVITADNVGLKLSLLVTYRLAEPHKAAHETQDWEGDLCQAAQLALHIALRKVTVEALLSQRLDVGAELLARVQPQAVAIGVGVLAIEIKDIAVPAELQRLFAAVLKTKRKGPATFGHAGGKPAAVPGLQHAPGVLEGAARP